MNFTANLHAQNLNQAAYQALVVPVYEDRDIPRDLKDLDKLWKGALSGAVKNEVLTAEGEIFIVPDPTGKSIKRVVFAGMGKAGDATPETIRRVAGISANALRKRDISRVAFHAEAFIPSGENIENTVTALIEGARLGSYMFNEFKTEKDKHELHAVDIHLPKGTNVKALLPILNRTLALTTSTLLARDWSNTPGNFSTPSHLAQLARDIAKEAGLNVRILTDKDCQSLGMGAFLGVAKGSCEPAKFIILEYKPKLFTKTICLVGKALTFDSGGISIKPGLDMHVMKADMAGGMAVIATMRALGILKPDIQVIGIVPACENMPSGSALKPGDIIRSMSGKSIEVQNTDAEGRLVLADGLEYARKEYEPDALVDVATLTGACVIALGDDIAGMFTDYDELAVPMQEASKATGELVWRMPLEPGYIELLKSDVADMRNIGKKEGGAITAALFLQKFVGDTPWMHLDIAGPMWTMTGKPYITKGATGYGPRLLYNFLTRWAELK